MNALATLFRPALPAALATSVALSGCMTADQNRAAVRDATTDRLTVGTVQRDLRIGMTSADVIAALGSPNIVATDDQRREVWTYDRITTEIVTSAGGISLLPLILGTGSLAGGALGSVEHSSSATARSQRTLTIIVKYDAQNRVRDFAYHASSF